MKFLQIADVHLGVQPEGIHADKLHDFFAMRDAAFAKVSTIAATEQVDALLIAGDLFDTPTPPLSLFRQAMTVLSRCPCPVILTAGNHDYIHADSPYLTQTLPKNVHLFDTPELTSVQLSEDCIIWGASFCSINASITLTIPRTMHTHRIGVLHGDLFGMSAHNPITKSEIQRSGLTYLAVGHNHRPSGLQHAGDTAYACTGSFMTTHRMDTGEKGMYLLHMHDAVTLDVLSTQSPEFMPLSLDLTAVPSDVGLRQALIPLIPASHARTIAVLTLTGERIYEPNLTSLRTALEQVFFQFTLLDESVVKKPLWRYLQQDDLRGQVSRTFRQKLETARTQEEKDRYMLAFRYVLAALDDDNQPL